MLYLIPLWVFSAHNEIAPGVETGHTIPKAIKVADNYFVFLCFFFSWIKLHRISVLKISASLSSFDAWADYVKAFLSLILLIFAFLRMELSVI